MKALVLNEYNKLIFTDFPTPEPEPNEVRVRIKSCGICGSDVHGMDGSTGRRIPPLIMGHEASGVIEKLGANVQNWSIGDRVTFDSTIYNLDDWYTRKGLYNLSDNRKVLGVSPSDYIRHGCFAEYAVIPQHILYKIPANVTFDQAAMVEPVAVAAHAVNITPIQWNNSAVVVGTGMIGLCIVQVLRANGAGLVIAIDKDEGRLELAKKLGADIILNADNENIAKIIKSHTENRGADIAFEAVGVESSIHTAISGLRRGGCLTLVGNLAPEVNIPLQSIVTQQLRLQGSCAICGEYPSVLDMIERGKINVDILQSASAPLSEGASWFKRLYNREKGLMKVVLNP